MSVLSLLANVLFVGHSLIGPNLPPLVEGALDRLAGPSVVQTQVINGASLAYNWDHAGEGEGVDARAVLAAGNTDILVLTEAQPIADQMAAGLTIPAIADFAGAAGAANPDTRVFVYESWPAFAGDEAAWRAAIAADLPLWQGAIAGAEGQSAGAIGLIPAGQAMVLLSQEVETGNVPGIATMRDFFSDDIHLSGKGLHFVALVHTAALTGESPEGLPPKLTRTWLTRDSVIAPDLAAALQRIAWAAVSADLPPVAENAATPAPDLATLQIADGDNPPLPPDLTPITNPNLGFGLAGVSDWSVQLPFLNLMKSARPWIAHKPGQYGGWEATDLQRLGLLSAQGWPLALPQGATGLTTLILTDLSADAGGTAGRYLVTWQGQGTLTLGGRAQVIDKKPFSALFDYTPGDGAVTIDLTDLHPTDPIRDIVVVRQDRAALLEGGEIFNPDFLTRLQGARSLRFMDWQATNNSPLASTNQRPHPDDFTYATPLGVPFEVQIALANRLHADPWFTVPHLADDALIHEMAALAHETLDPALTAHVEFSNEVWNWQFTQATWAEAQGKLRWGQDGTWMQYYGFRAAQMARIWREDFGADANRLVTVIATQTGVKGAEAQILDAPLVVAEGLPPPVAAFDAYGVTGYFAALLGSEEKAPMVRQWLVDSRAADPANPMTQAIGLASTELRDGSISGDPADTLAHLLGDILPYQASVAADRGLRLMMYEGGSHVVGYGPMVDDPELTEFFTALNYAPEMGALYDQLLAGWAMLTDAPFNAFVDTYRPGKWGSWGGIAPSGRRQSTLEIPRHGLCRMLSVIIPASNEEGYIGPCLTALFASAGQGAQAIVVANGCRDQTVARARACADIAAAQGWSLLVLDLPKGSKPLALTAGDGAAQYPVRVYLDADVIVSPDLMAALATALAPDRPLYATGTALIPPARSAFTRAYARFWQRLPFARSSAPGYGLFATNAPGRARWGDFPAIISDDTFVRLQFTPDERLHLPQTYHWPMIEGFAALARVRARQDAGVAELARLYPGILDREAKPHLTSAGLVRMILSDPLGFAAYAAVALRSRLTRRSATFTRGR